MAENSRLYDASSLLESSRDDGGEQTTSRPLSGAGASRQNRRLQLRNAGFRGSAVPTRKVTPKSVPSSNWSSVSGLNVSSDVENVSPAGTRATSSTDNRRDSVGILQEIGNSTVTRSKKTRPRALSGKRSETEDVGQDNDYTSMPTSPPPSRSTVRRRSIKMHPKVTHRRRSGSNETSKYIEHLEAELAATQSQLSSMSSPTVTREQSSKMRSLNAETKQLQQEIAEWEAKYEQRVQDAISEHYALETDLRGRIRNLEHDAEDAKFRIQELETSLETQTQNVEAVEAANVNLEKRLEIMSELLASTKIDLHAETPGRARRHVRPKSMLPRFPTASSLMGSPERLPQTQPTSPLFSFTAQHSPVLPSSPSHSLLPLDNSPLQSDLTSEAESVFSESHSIAGDSMTSVENNVDFTIPNFNPWSLPMQQHQDSNRTKPARRMRRFGAGSLCPKPLILPATTSNWDMLPPSSAPPLERSETMPAFFNRKARESDESPSPVRGRRRASTTANELTLVGLQSPFCDIPEHDFDGESADEDGAEKVQSLQNDASPGTTRWSSSFDSPGGRNLMDELRSMDSDGSVRQSAEWSQVPDEDIRAPHSDQLPDEEDDTSPPPPDTSVKTTAQDTSDTRLVSTSSGTTVAAAGHKRTRSRSVNIPAARTRDSAFQRLRILFGDLGRSPVALARYLIQTAQARMRIPAPLVNVQRWLVGVLLGPMAKRRLLTTSNSSGELEEQRLLLDDAGGEEEPLAYGTLYETPPASPKCRTSGRKRAGSKTYCPQHQPRRFRKHSPWLWLKFSITLAFAIGTAFKDGPGSLLKAATCTCPRRKTIGGIERASASTNEEARTS